MLSSMATIDDLKASVESGLANALKHERVAEADRALTYPNLDALLRANDKINNADADAKRRYPGYSRWLADFSEYPE